MPGTLYVVATPIGNLADITLRALSTLREVDLIAAEDTRVTHNLLAHYGIETPTTSFHQHSLRRKAEKLLQMLEEGKDVALVSDAGTPGISDPGHEMISLAIANDIPVVAIPGPNAIITALVVSGLDTRHFAFEGFLPRRSGERRALFTALADEQRTILFYESPNRLLKSLLDMHAVLGDRRIAIVREATKMFEEVHRGTISTAIERFTAAKPKGEITLVLAGAGPKGDEVQLEQMDTALRECLGSGMSARDAAREVSTRYPVSKNAAYGRAIEIKEGSGSEQ